MALNVKLTRVGNIFVWILLIAVCLFASCKTGNTPFGAAESKMVKDSVTQLTANIEKDITNKGAVAWLDYFEYTPDFFMASQGQLAFNDYQTARQFIQGTLAKSIPHIKLKWGTVRIDPLSPDIATVGADFHEELTDANNKTQIFDGYFTATAHHVGNFWRLRNAHWSIKPPVANVN